MSRTGRMKFEDPGEGCYHVIARTIQKMYLLKDEEKRVFRAILRKLSRVYFVKIATYCLMDNHVHVIVRMLPSLDFSDQEVCDRFEIYYNEGEPKQKRREFDPSESAIFRQRWGDISRFVQDLLQRFSRWYNRKYNGYGHVWGDRFKSVMLQSHRALMACMVYVDLNSVRAGMIKHPDEYPFCGLNQMIRGGRAGSWLDEESIRRVLEAWGEKFNNSNQVIQRYKDIAYKAGAIEQAELAGATSQVIRNTAAPAQDTLSFLQRIRHFTEGVFLGDKSFCEKKYEEFRSFFGATKERRGEPLLPGPYMDEATNLLEDLFSIRKFKTVIRAKP